MISLLTSGFVILFTGLVLFGHVLLLRDIFFGPSKRQPARRFNNGGMRHQKAA